MSRLIGKAALITGGGSGIGRATAEILAAHGARLVVLDKDGESAESVASEIRNRGFEAIATEVDLADLNKAEEGVVSAARALGRLDILVNNAATYTARDLFEIRREEWQKMLDVNLTAYFLCARAAAHEMQRTDSGGSIVNVSSVHQRISEPRSGAYAASKGGVAQLTRNLAIEFASYGIVVNSISPGFVRTRMSIVDGVDETTTEHFLEYYVESGRIPLGRAGLPEEVAAAALFFAARDCPYITGADLPVDGGLTITL